MRTLDRLRATRGNPSSIMLRLLGMTGMLVVLVMLINRASEPATWKWLANEAESPGAVEGAGIPNAVVTAPPEDVSRGPTDTDMEELASAVEESQAISDRTLALQPEEMAAYWRVFNWVENQSFKTLQDRSLKDPTLNQFMQSPDVSRRRIVQLNLNIRRVLKYEAPPNSADIKEVYEIWGFTDESQAWPYVVLTSHLPPGMPTGTQVHERMTFAGYFFKLQGYHAGGASPNDKPLAAPLLIGRVAWRPSALRAQKESGSNNTSWVWWASAAVVLFGATRLGFWYFGRSQAKPIRTVSSESSTNPEQLNDWLRNSEDDAADNEYNRSSLDDDDYVPDYPSRNGKHSRGDA